MDRPPVPPRLSDLPDPPDDWDAASSAAAAGGRAATVPASPPPATGGALPAAPAPSPVASPPPVPVAGSGPAPGGRLRIDGLTLVLTLGIVYVFASATLPALLERRALARRRVETSAEILRLQGEARTLADWNEAAATDPLVRERLAESKRLSPDAPGFRVLPDPEATGEAGAAGTHGGSAGTRAPR